MPDSSNNVNMRDGASIVWGPEIRVDGKRPEWLADGTQLQHRDKPSGTWFGDDNEWLAGELRSDDWETTDLIRLPADHPHYAKAPTTPELDPALWDRMVALVRDMASDEPRNYPALARAIVADLPKPVDPDLIEAREVVMQVHIARGMTNTDRTDLDAGKHDDEQPMLIALAAIKRGRELAAPEVSHVG